MAKHDPTVCSEQERRFVDALVGEAQFNASKAAKIAGYSGGPKGEAYRVRGSELLSRPRVQAELTRKRAEVAELEREANEQVRSEKLAELVKRRAESMLGPTLTAGELQRFWAAVTCGEIEGFSSDARLRASEMLAKSLGIFVHENEVAPALPVTDGVGPRLQVNVMIIDNGRGPLPPSKPVIAGDETRKALTK